MTNQKNYPKWTRTATTTGRMDQVSEMTHGEKIHVVPVERLGEGGLGKVFLSKSPHLQKQCNLFLLKEN